MLKNKLKIFLQTERIKSMLIVVAEAGPCNNNIEVCRMTLPKIVFNFNMRVVIMKDEMSFMFYNISVQVQSYLNLTNIRNFRRLSIGITSFSITTQVPILLSVLMTCSISSVVEEIKTGKNQNV